MPTIDTKKSGTITVRLGLAYIKLLEARSYMANQSLNETVYNIIKRDLDQEMKR